jgi:hypothetical protein
VSRTISGEVLEVARRFAASAWPSFAVASGEWHKAWLCSDVSAALFLMYSPNE